MKKICILYFFLLNIFFASDGLAQYVLDFDEKGKNINTFLPSVVKKGERMEISIQGIAYPESDYQKLIRTHNDSLYRSDNRYYSSFNSANFPYTINGVPGLIIGGSSLMISVKSVDDIGELTLKIEKPNVDNQLFKKLFFDRNLRSQYHDFEKYLPLYDSLRVMYDYYAFFVDKLALEDSLYSTIITLEEKRSKKVELALYLDSLSFAQDRLVLLVQRIKNENKLWMDSWKWFSEGKELLNPFYPNVAFLRKKIKPQINAYENLLSFINTRSSPSNFGENASFVEPFYKTVLQASNKLNVLLAQQDKLNLEEENYKIWLQSITTQSIILNEFKLFVSSENKADPIVWMHSWNAADDFKRVVDSKDLPGTVYEEDRVVALVHNIKEDQDVSATESIDTVRLKTETEKALEAPFETLAEAKSSAANILSLVNSVKGILVPLTIKGQISKSMSDFSTSRVLFDNSVPLYHYQAHPLGFIERDTSIFVSASIRRNYLVLLRRQLVDLKEVVLRGDANQQKSIPHYMQSILNGYNADSISTETIVIQINDLLAGVNYELFLNIDQDALRKYSTNKELIYWLSYQTPPAFSEIESAYKKSGNKPVYRSKNVLIGESKFAKGGNKIGYEIKETGKEKPVAKSDYTLYNTVRFLPSMGINYVFGSRTTSVFDNATSSFTANTTIDNFEAVVGVKIYFGKTNITRSGATTKLVGSVGKDNRTRGNDFGARSFGFVGLGVSHSFLKNYFFGIGHDLLPGVAIQGGANVFFKKGYDLDNGKIKREFDLPSCRLYVGLYLDPILVTKLIQLF